MIFLKESLYGWGVCNIPQPRATIDIFDDRRGLPHQTTPMERRCYGAHLGFWSMWSALVKRDLPALQVFLVFAVSLCMIILFGLASLYLPVIEQEEQPPLEILAMVLEEPAAVLPPIVEPKVAPVPQPELSQNKPVVLPLPKPVEPPPPVVLAPPKKTVSKLPTRVVALPEQTVEKTVLPGPRSVTRQYQESKVVAGPVPDGKISTSFAPRSQQDTLVASTSLGDRYEQTPAVSATALPKRKQSGLAVASGTNVDLPSTGGMQKNFKIAHSTQSMRGNGSAKTFVAGNAGTDISIRSAARVGGDFTDPLNKGVTSAGTPSGTKRSVGERVGMIGGTKGVEMPVLAGVGKASGSLNGTQQSASNPSGDGLVSGSVSFNGVDDGYYDPARMISLNQLNACIDPNAEWPLKTSLAAALDTNGKCSIRNMVFFFKNTENGYTLQVDVFNPENFVDRCEALRTAIQCINP
ncbi:MAG: hypothetical protein AB7D06_15835 [Pedobacter sp.]